MPSTGPTSKHPATPVITPALIAVPIRKEKGVLVKMLLEGKLISLSSTRLKQSHPVEDKDILFTKKNTTSKKINKYSELFNLKLLIINCLIYSP